MCPAWPLEVTGAHTKKAFVASRSSKSGTNVSRQAELRFHTRAQRNATRDMHSRFRNLGLSLPVPIVSYEHSLPDGETVSSHSVKADSWFRVLLEKMPECLVGTCGDVSSQLKSFWAFYEQNHSTHEVFKHHRNELDRCVPLALFGDEGRGAKRGSFLIWSIESLLGLEDLPDDWNCDCAAQLAKLPFSGVGFCKPEKQDVDDAFLKRAGKQMTNYKHHSYLTRHLLFGVPHWKYKSNNVVVEKHLECLANECRSLFFDGVHVRGQCYFGVIVACKGDMKHMIQMGIERSYHKLKGGMMCSWCHAGAPTVEFEETNDEPDWAETLFQTRPWPAHAPPILCSIPFDDGSPERLFALDAFHCVKVGVGRDLCGSMIVSLCRLTFFDSRMVINTLFVSLRFLVGSDW